MRTTLDIADDVLVAAKEIARRERRTAGQILSDLAREGLNQSRRSPRSGRSAGRRSRFLGFEPFGTRGKLVSNDLVNRLREEDAGG